jgi:uroporphyrinogen III methyltransferase/synthase
MKIDTPCAVIMRGTTSKQRKVVGTIQNIRAKVDEVGLKSPCIIVIGEVVDFHEEFNWYEKKPLFGMNVCITRSKEQAGGIRETLMDLGAEVTEINTIKIKDTSRNLDNYKDKLKDYNYVVFTSVNGVNVLFKRLKELKIDIRMIKAKFAAIGPATAEALMDKGIIPTVVADDFVAESLFEKLKAEVSDGDNILLPRSKNARVFLNEALIGIGCNVDEVFTYEVVEGNIFIDNPLDEVDIILFTSPSTVKNLIAMTDLNSIRSKRNIAIGPITGAELTRNDIKFDECEEYSIDGIVKKLLELVK